MPFIDTSYFSTPSVRLVVDGNEDALNSHIETFEPDYLRAVLGQSLYEAFIAGIATPTGVYFSNQFSDQFFKGTIAERWEWIRDGHVFTYGSGKVNWPGIQNVAKRSPAANYVYWQYLNGCNPSPSSTGTFTVAKMENAVVVSPYVTAMRAWNAMVEWNETLYRMITTLTDTSGDILYPEFVLAELGNRASRDVYHRQPLF